MKRITGLLLILWLNCAALAFAENKTVTGKVTDEENTGLPGVGISVKGTTTGASTNSDGIFKIVVPDKAVLVFQSIGYVRQEIVVGSKTELNVKMQESALLLSAVEVVGSRNINRSVTESPVAIDVIPLAEIATRGGQIDINQILQYAAPSFNSNRQTGADGTDHVDPATLRGLGPDQTLVLINGKRRHQSSLINIYGTRGRGNTGTDLNTIPAAAIERIEILRDGAAAQYGSDAIAGVINIVLKSTTDEFTGAISGGAHVSQDADGSDGESTEIDGNYGVKIGENGFVNVTLDYQFRGRTERPIDDGYPVYRRHVGDSIEDNFSAIYNAAIPQGENMEIYSFGGYGYRAGDAYAWSRDADDDRNVPEIYPAGFDPHILAAISDRSFSAGIKGRLKEWNVDVNNTFGLNRYHFLVDKTLNASLGMASPTRFDAGGFQLSQNTTGLYVTRQFPKVYEGANVAFGLEYRVDNYVIFAGEEASWQNYHYDKPGGAQGFPGFRPTNEVDEKRFNLGAYVDMEVDFSKQAMLAAAARFERYGDFGNTLNGKLAGRYEFSKELAMRGSVSSGFRAPSLAQIYYSSIFTDVVAGDLVDKVITRNNSPVTRALGIPELKEETATNASLGFTANLASGVSLTVDGYYVSIKDRIVLTGAFDEEDEEIGDDLQALGVSAAQFFTNAIDTRTTGVDVIIMYNRTMDNGAKFMGSLAANFNNMDDIEPEDITVSDKLEGKEDTYFGVREQYFLLASAPDSKINLTLDYSMDKWGVNARLVHFAKVELVDWVDQIDTYAAKMTADLSFHYNLSQNLHVTIGASNILDTYPDKQLDIFDDGSTDILTESGGMYDAVQMGSNGRMIFAKLQFVY